MTTGVDPQQIRRWQEAVARDPGDAAFLPLAELYRREGRLEVARRLCFRGLERQPELVEAHFLLGRIYREAGELDKALDEFDIALRLDPAHRGARRALGYLSLERRDWPAAVRHLEQVAAREPNDERAASALHLARRHLDGAGEEKAGEAATALAGALDRFVREARVRLVLLIDASGKILAQHGFSRDLDLAAFASLGAGVQAASRALAQMLGQERFAQLYQGQGEHQLFLGTVATPAGELVLVSVFGTETNIGLVRVRFDEFARETAGVQWSEDRVGRRVDAAGFDAELLAGLRHARAAESAPLAR